MKIKILTVGKTKQPHWQMAETDYLRRIQRYATLEFVSIKDASIKSMKNVELVKRAEAHHIKNRLKPNEFLIALDVTGKHISSEKFAVFLQEKMLRGAHTLVFIIGGPFGLAEYFLKQADMRLSLSEMTVPHELCKIVLLEQIYRAFTIVRGEKYHK